MLIGIALIIVLALGAALVQEYKLQKGTQKYLHDCFDQAYQMGAFSFDDQGCVFGYKESDKVNSENKAM